MVLSMGLLVVSFLIIQRVLQSIAACRGAMNDLMAEVIEGHISNHLVDPDKISSPNQTQAAQQLLDVVKTSFK